ncbi:ABC transporter ATP-binding protein [Aquamicrobium sp. NLF2-7]|uniref:ABC transporter ATP-binding protein n=1 Tax=Aquamicrobium sp. NLF2-7 TaxID=2918753 RepID=UPI001EFBDF40|nr:ABC transporter ATP-binding protein [Aquamicrobium sp. NLF2-7]MCG8272731.1 ABC transporter ATP-binding protein [Aquamicrobium sp. NLF2-7]
MTGLVIRNVNAAYGKSHILHDVSLSIGKGQVVTLLGRNGAGKTTTIRTIAGLLTATSGSIELNGTDITRLRPDQIVKRGIACVTEGRGIFTHLSAQENLALAERKGQSWTMERVLDEFPLVTRLLPRPGGALSGGEQQILAVARALMLDPAVLLLDEPSQGLAPVMVDRVLEVLSRLRATGLSMLIVEQKLDIALEIAEYAYVLENGRIALEAPSAELSADPATVNKYLGVSV